MSCLYHNKGHVKHSPLVHVNKSLTCDMRRYTCLYCSDKTVGRSIIKPVCHHSSSFVLVEVLTKTEWLSEEEREMWREFSPGKNDRCVNKATASTEIHFWRRVCFPCLHLLLNRMWRGKWNYVLYPSQGCELHCEVVTSTPNPIKFFRSYLTLALTISPCRDTQ